MSFRDVYKTDSSRILAYRAAALEPWLQARTSKMAFGLRFESVNSGVSHYIAEKILWGEPVRRDALAEFAQSLACSRSKSCRQDCSRSIG